MIAHFKRCDLFIVDALREKPHPTHPHLAMTLDGIARCEARHAILMHMDGSMDYDRIAAMLPDGVEPGYDQMEVTA